MATAPLERLSASPLSVPTDRHESDGTYAWDKTTIVVVHARAGGETGIGWTYGHASIAALIEDELARALGAVDVMDTASAFVAMNRAVRNLGRRGLAREAISAIDIAFWDLKAKLLDLSLSTLLGPVRHSVEIYGSGGFTSYDDGAR